MLKVVLPHAFNFGVPVARIVDLHRGGVDSDWMQKRAAVLTKDIAAVRPEKGFSFIHAISIGAQEAYGGNRNGDGFNEKSAKWTAFDPKPDGPKSITLDGGLQQFHRTFLKYAKVYKDHCFVDGTPVVMADRTRRSIESVERGESVATRGGVRRVVRTMRRHYAGVGVKLTLVGEPDLVVATAEHPFYVVRRDAIHCRHKYNRLAGNEQHAGHCREYRAPPGGTHEAPAVSLRRGDYLVFPRPKLGTVAVDPAFARLLGWVASEGYLGARGNIQFTFAENNIEDIAAVCKQFTALDVHVALTPREDGLVAVSACNKQLHAQLSRYVVGTYSDKRFTAAVFDLNEDAIRQLLSAYVDGDGCVQRVGAHRGDLRIRSSSPSMRRVLADLIRALGTPARLNDDFDGGPMTSPTSGQSYMSKPSGVVCVGRSFAGEIATGRKAAAVVEPRRAQTRDLLDDLYLVRIDNVQFVELDCDVNNLEVEDAHHYIAGEVLVHNCNKDPALSSGAIVAEAYNPEMRRGELLLKVQDDKWAPELEKMARGEDPPFSMSCFPAGTLIRTRWGFVPIEQIKRGTEVLTHRGRFRRAGNRSVRKVDELMVVAFKGFGADTLRATPNHPVYAARFEDLPKGSHKERDRVSKSFRRAHRGELHEQLSWVPAGELTDLHYAAVPIRHEVGADVSIREARLWGYYLAEGSVCAFNGDKASCTQFTVHKNDALRAEIHELADWGKVNDREHNLTPVARQLTCTGTQIAEQLRQDVGRASGKHVPEAVFAAAYSAKLAFVAAWFNADGWQDDAGLHWSMASSGRMRSLDLQQLLASMGIPASVYSIDHLVDRGIIKNKEYEYVVNVSNGFSDVFANVSKAAVIKKRTCPMSVFISGDYLMVPVKSVHREHGQFDVYNFSVEDDESYTAAHLAMHNCKVPYDICSACLNKAPSRAQYCDHLMNEMSQVKEAGHQIFAINDRPCFFDFSGVFRGADRIAFGLQKVASTGKMPEEFIPSTMLAEMWGLTVPNNVLYDSSPLPVQEKLAAMERLAAMEKQIEATGRLFNPEVDSGTANSSLPEDGLDTLRSTDLNGLMGALGQAQICLPMKDFFRLVLGDKYNSVAGEMDNAQSLLPGMFSRMMESGEGVEDVTGNPAYDPATPQVPKPVRDVIDSVKSGMSLGSEPVGRRLQITIIRGGTPAGLRKLSADRSGIGKAAEYLAKQYATYQLAFARMQEGAGDGLATGLALLQNYA